MAETDKAVVLDYGSPERVVTVGSSMWVRWLAGVVTLLLLGVIVYCLLGSRDSFGGLRDWMPAMAVAAGGAVYFALIALNIAGRRRLVVARVVGTGSVVEDER
ncbi:MAG TPA: hypothetical protein VH475_02485 [Tepidisphaeraceae bacterium]|jgi:hypothetical protein